MRHINTVVCGKPSCNLPQIFKPCRDDNVLVSVHTQSGCRADKHSKRYHTMCLGANLRASCNWTVNMSLVILCDFDSASSLICGNEMPTRCNRGIFYRSYFLLNMFRASLCPSSGAQEYYTVVGACGISCCGFQVAGLVWSWGLCVRFAGCCSILHRHQPLYNTLELLMMGIVVPETCWASNKICNKYLCCI